MTDRRRASVAPASIAPAALAALVAAATTWACLLAWHPLVENPYPYLLQLLVGLLGVATVGAVARWRGVRPLGVAALHLVVGSTLLLALTTGSLLPTPGAWTELREVLAQALASSRRYAAPVPVDAPPVGPLFVVVGMVAAVLLDLVALSWRRVAAAGLLLLALHLVPANLGVDVSWWLFCLVAAGFLALLALDTNDLVLRWGTPLEDDPSQARTRLVSTGNGGAAATRIGALATVGALALSSVLAATVPRSSIGPWSPGSGSGPQVTLTSPLVDMRRDLDRGADISLLVVDSERRPTYVRNAVLSTFDGQEWSTGDRSGVPLPEPDEAELPLTGVAPSLRRTVQDYAFTATHAFRSKWLPVMPLTTRVDVAGDWRWDRNTSDAASFTEELTTSGESWQLSAVELEYDAGTLDRAPAGRGEVPAVFSRLPGDLPEVVGRTAAEVTAGESSRFAKATALQDWFRSEFEYSLDRVETVDNDALVEFLSPDGRVGYCEQFAAAMAVMARTLGIPSRVAVGFLEPRRVGVSTWEFSSHDLHAWPELYFPGSGWVRFEPTPASRASGVPDYTEATSAPRNEPSLTASATPSPTAPTPSAQRPRNEPETQPQAQVEESFAWQPVAWTGLGLVVLAGLALTPQWLRQRRRRRRFDDGDPEALWAELRDTAVDLGLGWPEGRSPRSTGAAVLDWVDASSRTTVQEPLDRVVVAVERTRFARPGTEDEQARAASQRELGGDAEACVEALSRASGRGARWRARWMPRSLLARVRR